MFKVMEVQTTEDEFVPEKTEAYNIEVIKKYIQVRLK